MKGWTFSLLLFILPWAPPRCQVPHHNLTGQAMELESQTPFQGAKALAWGAQKGQWAAGNDYNTILVKEGAVQFQLPVGVRDKGVRISDKGHRIELGEVYFTLPDAERHITGQLWDATGRGYLDQVAYPQDGAVTLAFVRYGFSKGLDTPYEPILPAELLVLDASGKRLHSLLPEFELAERLSLAVGGDHIAAADFKRLSLWNWRTGELLHTEALQEHERFPVMAMSPDGRQLALSDGNGSLRLLRLLPEQSWGPGPALGRQDGSSPAQLCFAADGQALYAVGGPLGLLAWSMEKPEAAQVAYTGDFQAVAVAPDGQHLLVADTKTVYLLRR
jgi:hypothetical protein